MSETTKTEDVARAGRSSAPRRPQSPEIDAALQDLQAARAGAVDSMDELTDATKRALDVPAKIRRNPVKSAALIGGTGFLIVGGPRRVLRYALSRARPESRDPHAGLLPDEIEQVLKDSGLAQDPEIRRALDEDFADYLRRKGRYDPEPTASSVLWRTFDRVAGPLGTAGARVLVQRLMSAEKERASVRATARREARRPEGSDKAR
jgi:hypothetical protein